MAAGPITRDERDALVSRIKGLFTSVFEPDPGDAVDAHEQGRRKESLFAALAEYGDRLPRVRMSTCPYTGAPYLRAFDPFGLDGPWWHKLKIFDIEEPQPPKTFRVILGALALHGRTPSETTEEVLPGPEVPFVVPRLLGLPGMVAVVSRLEMATGDAAYPIVYFSDQPTEPALLHQFWLRQDYWFADAKGRRGFIIANDPWDFDLAPWVGSGKLKWIAPGDASGAVADASSGAPCPYLGLAGDPQPQSLEGGERELLEPPDGTPVNPFDE